MSSHPDSQPFDAPLEELRTRLYKIAHMMLGESAAAEDVAQETLARAIEHVGNFHGGDFFAWVCTIAINLCRARRRATQRGPVSMDPAVLERHRLASPQPGPATRIVRNEAHERAAVAMERLPEHLREAFILHYIEDLPYEAISEILGISVGAARLRAMRARKALRADFFRFLEPEVRSRLGREPEPPPAAAV
jgi:RNA polymerase sigma-70 factor (ECF subfamily)